MPTIKQAYQEFLKSNFKGLRIKAPLFYNWQYGLRFDLQVGETNTEEYFQEVNRRASTIFKAAFEDTDQLYLVHIEYKYKQSKIRFNNFVFRQIEDLKRKEIAYTKDYKRYETYLNDVWNIAIILASPARINYKNIIAAIGTKDFPYWEPRLDQYGALTSKEIYFININKRLVFNMYDDRGLDVIAADKEILRPIYQNYNDWILDYDREQIDKVFK